MDQVQHLLSQPELVTREELGLLVGDPDRRQEPLNVLGVIEVPEDNLVLSEGLVVEDQGQVPLHLIPKGESIHARRQAYPTRLEFSLLCGQWQDSSPSEQILNHTPNSYQDGKIT
jgi:hypothetical protein